MPSPVRLGLLGFGYAGQTFHAPLIAGSGATELVAIATRQRARAAAAWPDVAIVDDLGGLLADPRIEGIVVATPNDTHIALAHTILAAGRHVVVDKPVAPTSAGVSELAAAARDRGVVLAPFHNRRYDGDFLTVRALLDRRALGRVTAFESHFDRFRPQVRDRWREDAARAGGLLLDLGPHLVDQALALFGRPATVQATLARHRDGATADDYVHLALGYPGLEVQLHATALAALESPRFVIHGTRGSYRKVGLDPQEADLLAGRRPGDPGFGADRPGTLRVVDDGGDRTGEHPTLTGDHAACYRDLAAAVRDGAPLPIGAEDALDGLRVLELARESHALGRRLPFR